MIGFETQTSGFGATAMSTEPQPLSKIKGEMHKWPRQQLAKPDKGF